MSDRLTPNDRISAGVLLGSIALGLYLCYRLAVPFLPPLVWALTLAILFQPLHAKLRAASGSAGGAASVAVGIIAAAVVIPAIFVFSALLAEAVKGAALIGSVAGAGKWQTISESHPWLSPTVTWIEKKLNVPELIGTATTWLTAWSASLIRGSFASVVNLLLTFYFLFYFLRDGRGAMWALQRILPLAPPEFVELSERVTRTVEAAVYGTIAVAALQGALGGLMFWWLEMPAPFFWGVIMGLLAVVPFLGAFVIWAPVAVYLALAGDWGAAAILTLWGTTVIGLIDNLLYPTLVGDKLMMHTVPAFIAVVGGLMLFGPHGVILGPLAATVSVALLQIWRNRSGSSREGMSPPHS